MAYFLKSIESSKRPRRHSFFCWMILAALLAPGTLWGQAAGGVIRGTIKGTGQTPLAQASVEAVHAGTGQAFTAVSNPQGQFELAQLPPGSYRLQASHAGYVPKTNAAFELHPGESAAVEFALEPQSQSGGEKTTPDRAGAEARRASTDLIREDQLIGLPLNGRSYSALAALQTGVSDSGNASATRGVGGGNLSVAGGRSTSNTYLMDGTNIQNAGNSAPRSAAGVQLGSDAVYQVQVNGTTYSAEYGRGSGGVLNSITRSGGDQFHGTLFEFFRNSKLDARNFFDVEGKPPFKRNQFGFLLSGPVRKGKTYFMGSFEAMRDRQTDTDISFVPDRDARRGIITNRDGTQVLRVLPVHESVKPYLALYPPDNGERQGDGIAETIGPRSQPVDENFFVVRVDHQLTQRDSSFLRYSFDDASNTQGGSLFLFRTLNKTRQQYLTLVTTHIFSPSSINTVRLGYTRPASTSSDASEVQIPPSLYFVPGGLSAGVLHVDGFTDYGPSESQPSSTIMNTFQFADDVVLQRGPHALKIGAEVHRYRWDSFESTSKWGVWSFNSVDSLVQAGPEATTNLTVALPGSDSVTALRQTLAGFYLQDAYRVSRQLDLNLGLRYEFTTRIHEKDGKSAYLADIVRDTQPAIGPYMQDNPSLANFSPRVGLTWAPWAQRDTLVSAGFGIYHDQILYYLVDSVKNALPFYGVAVLANIKAQGIFPNAITAASGANFRLSTKTLDSANIKLPSVLRYNFTLQQPFAGWTARAAYVGARGNHLMRGYEANLFPAPVTLSDGSLCFPPDIAAARASDIALNPACAAVPSERAGPINRAFNSIELYSTDAQSFYNSLQLSLNRNAGRGMSVQVSYTFAKSVDDASNIGTANVQYGFDRKLERALSSGDQRHRLSVNYFVSTPRRMALPALGKMLEGWRLGGIASFRTGTPLSVLVSARRSGYLFSPARPNLRPGFSNNPSSGISVACQGVPDRFVGIELGGPNRYFDPCAFDLPPPGTVGNVGRNTLIAPGALQIDVSLQREFVLGGEKRFQFRTEIFNLPNHPSFSGPPGQSNFAFNGTSGNRNSRVGRITRTSTTARQIQFAMRLSF